MYNSKDGYNRYRKKEDRAPRAEAQNSAGEDESSSIVFGRNPVMELLKSDRTIDKLFVRRGDREGSITVIVAECLARKIPVIEVDKAKLDSLAGRMNHQGVAAMAAMKDYCSIDDIFKIAEERGEKPFIVVADEIEDPHNLGALIRCAEGAGAHGLIIPKRRSAGLTSVVQKASAGALEHLAIAKVANIASALDELKERNVWVYGAEADGAPVYDTKFDSATAIVVGSEGFGISRLVREKCDFIVSIPMYGRVNSFNVSCAAAVILCEAARQLKTK
ncbi:MAG: 23S rRNA (guanosine(2251)-2'-O)-methyltransferase RlmB [Candidatus Flemingiibacterium sp.]